MHVSPATTEGTLPVNADASLVSFELASVPGSASTVDVVPRGPTTLALIARA